MTATAPTYDVTAASNTSLEQIVRGELQSQYGIVRFNYDTPNHVRLTATLTVNGVDYNCSLEAYRDKGWSENQWSDFQIRRHSSDPNYDKGASDSARNKVYGALKQTWAEYFNSLPGFDSVCLHAARMREHQTKWERVQSLKLDLQEAEQAEQDAWKLTLQTITSAANVLQRWKSS